MTDLFRAVDYEYRSGATQQIDLDHLGNPVPPPPTPVEPSFRDTEPFFTLVALNGVTGGPLIQFNTVDVDSYVDAILGLRPASHNISVAKTDPAWRLLSRRLGETSSIDLLPDIGSVVHRVSWQLWRDGTLVAEGLTDGAVQSDDRIKLRIVGGAGLFRARFLGDGGINDLLNGRGEWPTPSLSGWTITHEGPGLQYRFSTVDPFQGARMLQLRGGGVLRSPWTTPIQAQPQGAQLVATEAVTRGAIAVRTEVLGGTDGQNQRGDPDQFDWQTIRATGTVPAGTGGYRARAVLTVLATDWIDVGRVRVGQTEMVGALPRNPTKLETLIQVVVQASQWSVSGGDLGVETNIISETGSRDAIRWTFKDNPTVLDALSSIVDRSDGPDVWFTPDRKLNVARRAGMARTDIALNRDTVVAANIQSDTNQRYDSLRVSTGFGAGTDKSVIATETRTTSGAPVRRSLLQAPAELSYRSAGFWAEGQAEFAALVKTSLQVWVPEWFGLRVNVGDRLRTDLDVDGWRVAGQFRVGLIEVFPKDGLVMLEVGLGEFDNKAGSRWAPAKQGLSGALFDTDFGGGGSAVFSRLLR